MRRTGSIWRLAGICTCLPALAVHGEVRTFSMRGNVSSKSDPVGKIDFAEVGSSVSFTFSFDSNTPDTNSTPTLAEYYGLSSHIAVGTAEIDSGQPYWSIQHPTDEAILRTAFPFRDFLLGTSAFKLLNGGGSALTDTALPSVPYDLGLFNAFFVLGFDVPNPGQSSPLTLTLSGPITTFILVPEPGTAGLLSCCLLLLLRCRRR